MNVSNRRILFIQPSLQAVGGIEKVVPLVAAGLAANSTVFAQVFYGRVPENQSFWSGRYEGDEGKTVSLWHKLTKVIRRAQSTRLAIRDSGASVVIVSAQGAILIVLTMKLLRLIRVPVIAYVHEARGDGGWLYRIMTGLIYPVANGWIGVSAGICEEIKRIPFVTKDRVVLAYNAVTAPNLAAEAVQKVDQVMSSFERPVLISAGRFERTKGVDILVDSFLRYADNHPGTLVLLGSGSLQSELQLSVTEVGKETRVKFLGQVEEPRAYMAKADVYVSSARSEPFGLALIEALSVGVPVAATDVPSGPREILSPEITPTQYPFRAPYGILLAPPTQAELNATNFEQALDGLFGEPYDEDKLKHRAQEFSPQAQLQSITNLLNKLLV